MELSRSRTIEWVWCMELSREATVDKFNREVYHCSSNGERAIGSTPFFLFLREVEMEKCLARVDDELRNLRAVRRLAGATLDDVSAQAGVSKALLSRFEQGKGRLRRRHLEGYWVAMFPSLYKYAVIGRGKP